VVRGLPRSRDALQRLVRTPIQADRFFFFFSLDVHSIVQVEKTRWERVIFSGISDAPELAFFSFFPPSLLVGWEPGAASPQFSEAIYARWTKISFPPCS